MRLRAIQQPGNAGALLDCFIRAVEHLPHDSRELSRPRYDESGAIEEGGTCAREKDEWQRCNE